MKGIFSNSAPPKKLHRWDGFALRTAAVPIANTSRIRKELVPWSPLTSESEDCSSNLKFQRSLETGHSSTEHVLNEASTAIEEDFSGSEAARYEARMEIDEHTPPEDNEQACHLPHFPVLECQQEHHCVPEIREPTPRIEDESSDAWTGDDEFLPRSARRQKRIDRKTVASPKFNASARTFTSQHLRAPGMPQSGLHVGEGYAWPVSRTSGFKGRAPVPCYRKVAHHQNREGVTLIMSL